MSQTQILIWCIALIVLELKPSEVDLVDLLGVREVRSQAQGLRLRLQVGHVPNSVQRFDRLIFDLYEITPEDLLLIRSYRRVRPGHLAGRGA